MAQTGVEHEVMYLIGILWHISIVGIPYVCMYIRGYGINLLAEKEYVAMVEGERYLENGQTALGI